MSVKYVNLPLNDERTLELHCGDTVYLSGSIIIARDAAHKRLVAAMKEGNAPFSVANEIIYYAGPAPTPPGYEIGPVGPTTSYRMDPYTPFLLANGLRGMIGKGKRSEEVLEAIKKHKAVYFGATGGAAVLIASSVKKNEVIAYEDLGPEAVLRIEVENMQLTVIADPHGGNLYESGPAEARTIMQKHIQ